VKNDKIILLLIFLPLIIAATFEMIILGIAYFNADEIECNLLWCEFKTSKLTIKSNSECYQNGVQINCTSMPLIMKDYMK